MEIARVGSDLREGAYALKASLVVPQSQRDNQFTPQPRPHSI